VYARDIPNFLAGKGGPSMRRVHFGLGQRLEMAITWAVPISLLASITLLFWARGFTSLLVLIWGVTLTVYAAFPLYEDLVQRGGFGALTALFGGLTVAGVIVAAAVRGSLELPFLLRWTGLGLATVVLVGFDLAGSTPLYKSWSHEERRYDVALDGLLCTACGQCAQVCPRGVFEVGDTACVPHAERCEQCGACIVQCPVDALSFITPEGDRITPDIIRRYKLNLLGKRRVGSGSA
jgi:ferredoxin